MKKITKFLSLSIVMLAFAANTFAQVSATARATATIVTPIAISKTVDMNFGNVASSAALGTVVLTPAGGRSVTGGVTLPATAGTVAAASFTVTGMSGYGYIITLPPTCTIGDGAGHTMLVNTFTSNPVTPGTLTGGTSTLTVGATLNVAALQAAGLYDSQVANGGTGDFTVTVNYQ